MGRTRVRWPVVALVSLALSLGFLAGRASGEPAAESRRAPPVHVVRPGDTLWEIARVRVGPEGDPRPLVIAMIEENGLGPGPLLPGMAIAVPDA